MSESVAYLTMAAVDIDSGCYSFGYLAGWTRDRKRREAIMAMAGKVSDILVGTITSSQQQASSAA